MTVYTANCGKYDQERTDIKCYTEEHCDNPRLSAKFFKVMPHLVMPDEPWWLWVDANLTLKDGALNYIDKGKDCIVFENPYRKTVGEEMEEIKRLKLDDPEIVDAQSYDKNGRLPACFLIFRKNTPKIRRQNEKWWQEITQGSIRDQISFPTAFPDAHYLPKVHPFDNKYFSRHGHISPRQVDSK